jgi:cytoskeletal protein CcmA (bactofilin family)
MIFRKNRPENTASGKPAAEPAPTQEAGPQPAEAAPAAQVATGAGQSILTSDVVMEGNLVTSGDLYLDGTVHGAVQAQKVVVDSNGAVSGQLVAQEVEIRGRVIGPICAVRVRLVPGAQVEGDVMSQSLSVDEGAFIDGQIRHSEDPLGEWQQMWYGEEGHGAEDAGATVEDTPDLAPYLRQEGVAEDENGESENDVKEEKAGQADDNSA